MQIIWGMCVIRSDLLTSIFSIFRYISIYHSIHCEDLTGSFPSSNDVSLFYLLSLFYVLVIISVVKCLFAMSNVKG